MDEKCVVSFFNTFNIVISGKLMWHKKQNASGCAVIGKRSQVTSSTPTVHLFIYLYIINKVNMHIYCNYIVNTVRIKELCTENYLV